MNYRLIERNGNRGNYRFVVHGFPDLSEAVREANRSPCEYLIEDIAGKVIQYRIAD